MNDIFVHTQDNLRHWVQEIFFIISVFAIAFAAQASASPDFILQGHLVPVIEELESTPETSPPPLATPVTQSPALVQG